MADLRITPGVPAPAPARPLPAARAEAIRAAQRAFFHPATAPAPPAAPTPLAFDAQAPQPARPLRPGSLLDIKV